MTVSRSHTMHTSHPPLTIGGTVLKETDDLFIFGVTFDFKMTFEKHLRSVCRAASQRLGVLKTWRLLHGGSLLEICFRSFVLPALMYCSAVWSSAADTHLKLLDRAVNFIQVPNCMGDCLSVILPIVDLWQYYLCCIKSDVTRCTRLMVLYRDSTCQCGLHAVPWSHIGIFMLRLAAEPRNIASHLFPSQFPSVSFFLTSYSMVWDWRLSSEGPMLFNLITYSIPSKVLYYFPFLFFLSIGWYSEAGVFRLMRCTYTTHYQPCTADLF